MDYQITVLRTLLTRVIGDGPVFARIRAILTSIEKEASGILELMKHPDPMKSSAAIDLLINQEKSGLRALIAKSRSEADALVASFRASQEAARVAKGNLKPDAYATEIRAVFRALAVDQKNTFLAMAIKAGDGATAGAILGPDVPLVLVGLTEQQAEQYRESFLDTVAGPSSKNIADELQAVCDTALRTADSLAQPTGIASGTQTIEAQKAASLAERAA